MLDGQCDSDAAREARDWNRDDFARLYFERARRLQAELRLLAGPPASADDHGPDA